MKYKVDNAIIMAAGMSSRFAPLSYEKPKALLNVKGEILIERQIKQLIEAGVPKVIIVVGYKKEQFYYLKDKFGVEIIENKEYLIRNNNSSIYVARNYLKNSYICSADNYFSSNPFESEVDESYYSVVYAKGITTEWCVKTNKEEIINNVTIGGKNDWYMLGHTFWSNKFSELFKKILEKTYKETETKDKLWEKIYIENLDVLKMKVRKYNKEEIFEFDSLDELRKFDDKYIKYSGSNIILEIKKILNCGEDELKKFKPLKNKINKIYGCKFNFKNNEYKYEYKNGNIDKIV